MAVQAMQTLPPDASPGRCAGRRDGRASLSDWSRALLDSEIKRNAGAGAVRLSSYRKRRPTFSYLACAKDMRNEEHLSGLRHAHA